jgi:alkaline phosphatase
VSRRGLIAAVLLLALLATACVRTPATPLPASASPVATVAASASAQASVPPSATPEPTVTPAPEPAVLLAAGDVADCELQGVGLTTELLVELLADHPEATIAVLGDVVYPSATAERFDSCYDPTWGQFVERTRPAIGNHDMDADAGAHYYATFGEAAGSAGEGWYSYELGEWHVVVLNANCDRISCEVGSLQHAWLVEDLAQSDAECTLAYWHHPRFTSGPHGDDPRVGPFWTALVDAGADVVLAGHDHHYERFAPMNPDGALDPDGIRQFIAGTGGGVIRPTIRVAPGSEAIVDDQWGVLRLELSSESYAWSFLTVQGAERDAGSGLCH